MIFLLYAAIAALGEQAQLHEQVLAARNAVLERLDPRRLMSDDASSDTSRYTGKSRFDDLESTDAGSVLKSVNGYILLVTNVHDEAQEDDIFDIGTSIGEVSNLHLNLDRRTGFCKGYAFVEYKNLAEAEEAVETLNGETVLEKTIGVSWAFVKMPNRRRRLADDEFYLRYYVGHRGKFGHEFLEFEFRNNGLLRYANNSKYKNAQLIRKQVNLSLEVIWELKRIIEDSEILKEDDNNWPQPNEVGRQEIEIVMGNEHISFVTTKIGSTADVDKSDDPEGLRNFYYVVQDLKVFVFSLIHLHFKIKPIG